MFKKLPSSGHFGSIPDYLFLGFKITLLVVEQSLLMIVFNQALIFRKFDKNRLNISYWWNNCNPLSDLCWQSIFTHKLNPNFKWMTNVNSGLILTVSLFTVFIKSDNSIELFLRPTLCHFSWQQSLPVYKDQDNLLYDSNNA